MSRMCAKQMKLLTEFFFWAQYVEKTDYYFYYDWDYSYLSS